MLHGGTRWVLVGLALGAGLNASAETGPGGPADKLEEIVVTAQRRSENLQEVPLSITALSAAVLEEKGVNTFFDYAGQVPNLAFANTGDGSGTARTVSIRGISGDGTTGFYIDETPVPDSIDPRVLDVERIEVLRGPQGTLYGARSMGGTVRMITQQPSFDRVSGRVSANGSQTANADSANYGIDGAFNLPLSDTAALRVVGFYQHDGGFFKRQFLTNPADATNVTFTTDPTMLGGLGLPTTTRSDIGRVNSYGGALSLAIKAGSALTFSPRLMYQKAEANGFLYSDVGTYPVPVDPAAPVVVSMRPSGFTQYRFFDVPESSSDEWVLGSLGIKYDASVGTFLSSTSYFDRTVDETEDQTDFLWQNLLAPFDGIPLGDINDPNAPPYHAVPIASSIRELKQIHRFVQEMRFTSNLSGPWQYVAGFFYSDTRGRVPFAGYYPPSIAPGISQTGGFVVTGIPGLPIPVNPLIPDEIFGSDAHTKVTEPALYGELSYNVNEAVKVTVGLRGYRIKTETNGYLEGIAFGGARLTDPTAELSESGVNPKLGMDWRLAADKLLYLQVARGFRPGGIVPSIPGNEVSDPLGCFAQLQALGYTNASQTKHYDSDSLWSYEVGAKTGWLDNRVTVNGAGFYVKWDQIQQLVALRCGFQFRANAGAADIKGAELEVHAQPTPNLNLTLGAGYQRARITDGSPLLPAQQPGDRVYQVPDWTGNAAASYTVPFAGDRNLVTTVSWTYTGDTVSASVDANTPRLRPAYSILDARVAFRSGPYEAALVGKNLTDELANLGDNRSLAAETIGRPRLVVNTPRTLGVELRARF
jgi:iron complex outermembrane receptor protein